MISLITLDVPISSMKYSLDMAYILVLHVAAIILAV